MGGWETGAFKLEWIYFICIIFKDVVKFIRFYVLKFNNYYIKISKNEYSPFKLAFWLIQVHKRESLFTYPSKAFHILTNKK